MGRCPHNKSGGQKKKYLHKTARLTKFLRKGDDIIYEEAQRLEISALDQVPSCPLDDDLPGRGQFYCLHCDRHFASASVKDEHCKSKLHRRRVKRVMNEKPHSQLDADLAGGLGMPDNGPKVESGSMHS